MKKIYSPLTEKMIEALQCLPGVGSKSAQRMVFYILNKDREGGKFISDALSEGCSSIKNCSKCRMLTEEVTCSICLSTSRDDSLMCVVETPADVVAIEQSVSYRGKYFVLMGHLSPIDGIGPKELSIDLLSKILDEGYVKEIILATSVTIEGDATADYIASIAKDRSIVPTRIAYGIPMGGELEFVDSGTLSRAITGRREIAE
ncbi:MAG: recombination protein RecR [Gammaproteobacteria bacterium TMED78]|mgnify:CR=1 FL=1|nr:MAG: recombination protein RecR [Gammaproteobacteria bacterium TMED78]|tara:strand:+ start:746 stop:1354 length:609 start_codon:yes stop_codon:yes gene_type:complete